MIITWIVLHPDVNHGGILNVNSKTITLDFKEDTMYREREYLKAQQGVLENNNYYYYIIPFKKKNKYSIITTAECDAWIKKKKKKLTTFQRWFVKFLERKDKTIQWTNFFC